MQVDRDVAFMNQLNHTVARFLGMILVCPFFTGDIVMSQTSGTSKRGEVYYRRGKVFADRSQCRLGLVQFDKAIAADPSAAKYYVAKAECAYVTEWFDVMEKSRGDQPGFPNKEILARETAAWIARIDGHLAEALRLDSDHGRAYFIRAKAHAENHRHTLREPAVILADFERAIELEPKNAEFYAGRAEFHFSLNDNERALRDYDAAMKLQPRNIEFLERRANFYRYTKQWENAVRDATTILTLKPRKPSTRLSRSDWYLELGQHAKALKDINDEMRYFPTNMQYGLQHRARVYRAMGKIELAEADEKRAREMHDEMLRQYENAGRK
jgi:tetratricopeptide (TPR) repeat protein